MGMHIFHAHTVQRAGGRGFFGHFSVKPGQDTRKNGQKQEAIVPYRSPEADRKEENYGTEIKEGTAENSHRPRDFFRHDGGG